MRLLNDLILSFETGHHTAIIHSVEGCPLNCMGCFNQGLVNEDSIDPMEMIEKLKIVPKSFNIVLSGGEFLKNEIIDMILLLSYLKQFNKTILYTNGMYPEKLKTLLAFNLIKEVHMDIKIPFINTDKHNFELYSTILGIEYKPSIGITMGKSFDILVEDKKSNGRNHKFRTIKYPNAPQDYFKEIEYICKEKGMDYSLNEYISAP